MSSSGYSRDDSIADGGFHSGRVLTSDATGLASWQPSVSNADFSFF